MQAPDLVRPQHTISDLERGASQAYRRGVLDCKTDGLGHGAETPRPLCESARAVAAQEKLPGRLQDMDMH